MAYSLHRIIAATTALALAFPCQAFCGSVLPRVEVVRSSRAQIFERDALIARSRQFPRLFNKTATVHQLQWIAVAAFATTWGATLFASDFTPRRSSQDYVDLFANHLQWGVGFLIIQRLWSYSIRFRFNMEYINLFALTVYWAFMFLASHLLTTTIRSIFPGAELLARSIVEFFIRHSNWMLAINYGLFVLLGLSVWQKLNTRGWPRIIQEVKFSDKTHAVAFYAGFSPLINYGVLAYGFVRLQSEMFFYIPFWALLVWVIHEFDRQFLARTLRPQIRRESGPHKAISVEAGAPGTFVRWEKEVDWLRWGGHFLMPAQLILPVAGWDPWPVRLGQYISAKLRLESPATVTAPNRLAWTAA